MADGVGRDWGLGELTEPERRLCAAFARGDVVDLRAGVKEADDATRGATWGAERQVRAEVLAALLLSEAAPAPGRVPGVYLTGARVVGALNLEFAQVQHPLRLRGCWFENTLCLDSATLRPVDLSSSVFPQLSACEATFAGSLRLTGCRATKLELLDTQVDGGLTLSRARLSNPGGHALNADRLAVTGNLFCQNGFTAEGEVRLLGARIDGQLYLSGARLTNPGGRALTADRLAVTGNLFCQNGFTAEGGVRIVSGRIGGQVSFSTAKLSNPGGRALDCEGLTAQSLWLSQGFTAEGEVRLLSARIDGQLYLSGARLTNPGGRALNADGITVHGDAFCQEGFTTKGEVQLSNARIDGSLVLSSAKLSNPGGYALNADQLSVARSMHCRGGFRVEGEMRLLSASIKGQLSLTGAQLSNRGGYALNADRLAVTGSVFCREGFRVEGEMRLLSARIDGQLDLGSATLSNPGGYALNADRLAVTGNLFCQNGFTAEGGVRIVSGRVDGQVSFSTAKLTNPGGRALDCERLTAQSLWLSQGFTATGRIDLTGATVGTLHDSSVSWPTRLALDEFTYQDLEPDLPAKERLTWLARCGTTYRPQPYEQLASYYRRQGHDEQARQVLLAKHRHHRREQPWHARSWGYLLDAMVGYGFRPARAASWMLLLWVIGSAVFAHWPALPLKPNESPPFQPVLYAADLLLPIINLGQESAFNPTGPGQWLAPTLVTLGWILATAAVTGITRVLNRS